MRIFARITKVNALTRQVTGILAQECVDRSGEIFDYESSKQHFKAWSEGIAKATDGKSVGNMRSMHSNLVAGKFTDIQFDDAAKAIEVTGEVVDDNEWKKVESGCYTGFSIGGKYANKWADPADATKKRYTAIPSEGSLVDMPCIPTAQFKVVKADGVEELHKFHVEDSSPVVKVLLVDGAMTKAAPLLAGLAGLLGEKVEKFDEAAITDLLGKAATVEGPLANAVKALDASLREIAYEHADPEAAEKAAADELAKRNAVRVGELEAGLASANEQLTKAQGDLTAAGEALSKATGERDTALAKVTQLESQVKELQGKVAPTPAKVFGVHKGADVTEPAAPVVKPEDVKPVLKADGTIDHMATANAALKSALGHPMYEQSKL
jgi:hypothetical protein